MISRNIIFAIDTSISQIDSADTSVLFVHYIIIENSLSPVEAKPTLENRINALSSNSKITIEDSLKSLKSIFLTIDALIISNADTLELYANLLPEDWLNKLSDNLKTILTSLKFYMHLAFLDQMVLHKRDINDTRLQLSLNYCLDQLLNFDNNLIDFDFIEQLHKKFSIFYILNLLIEQRNLGNATFDDKIRLLFESKDLNDKNKNILYFKIQGDKRFLDDIQIPIKSKYVELLTQIKTIRIMYPADRQLTRQQLNSSQFLLEDVFKTYLDMSDIDVFNFIYGLAYPEKEEMASALTALKDDFMTMIDHWIGWAELPELWIYFLCLQSISPENIQIPIKTIIRMFTDGKYEFQAERIMHIFYRVGLENIPTETYKEVIDNLLMAYEKRPHGRKANEILQLISLIVINITDHHIPFDVNFLIEYISKSKIAALVNLDIVKIIHEVHTLSSANSLHKQLSEYPSLPLLNIIIFPSKAVAFYNLFEKANKAGAERYQKSQDIFVSKFFNELIQLKTLLGEDGLFNFLKNYMITSIVPLERILSNFFLMPKNYQEIIHDYLSGKPIDKNNYESIERLLFLVGILAHLEANVDSSHFSGPELLQALFDQIDSLDKINTTLNKGILSIYTNLLLKVQVDEDKLIMLEKKMYAKNTVLLLLGRKAMHKKAFENVFDEMIKIDFGLSECPSFKEFTTNEEQQSTFGQELARHNNAIKQQLENAGINTEIAFNYKFKRRFNYYGNSAIDMKQLAFTILQAMKNILIILKDKSFAGEIYTNIFQKIGVLLFQIDKARFNEQVKNTVYNADNINALINFIEGIKSSDLDKLQRVIDPSNLNQLKSIARLTKVAREQTGVPIKPEFNEHTTHFEDYLKSLTENIEVTGSSKIQETKSYIVEQWDKSKPETFLLGKYLSCCLSPDGSQFPAMVQRRMDGAMMMHVVIDVESQLPVCGNWLFFATDKNNPNDVYVVANFFEITASIGLKSHLRDTLVKNLIAFTADYAKKVNAKGFLMRHLGYGLIPDFQQFPEKKVEISKVGGYLQLSENHNLKEAQKSYYLDAIKDSKNKPFNLYTDEGLAREFPTVLTSATMFHDKDKSFTSFATIHEDKKHNPTTR